MIIFLIADYIQSQIDRTIDYTFKQLWKNMHPESSSAFDEREKKSIFSFSFTNFLITMRSSKKFTLQRMRV